MTTSHASECESKQQELKRSETKYHNLTSRNSVDRSRFLASCKQEGQEEPSTGQMDLFTRQHNLE